MSAAEDDAPAGDLLTLAEAVRALKTTRATFQRWLKAGRIAGAKVGRQWRFRRSEIERFLRGETPRVESTAGLADLAERLGVLYREAAGAEWSGEGGVAGTIDLLLDLAVRLRATDVHVDPRAQADPEIGIGREGAEGVVRIRVDGVLRPLAVFDLRLLPALASRLKEVSGCDVRERVRPQEGRLVAAAGDSGKSYDFRVCFLPAALGECVTVRILDPAHVSFRLERLGIDGEDLARIRRALDAPAGLVVVTGPTGSGKTTTHYSCLCHVVRPDRKVLSIEDPVEYHLPGVVQVPVREDAGVTFGSAFRSVMRSDPDVVLVGEIRSRETLLACCQAAMTGHLVQTTLHTANAAAAVRRMLDLGIDAFLVAESLRLVLAQRIVRVLCPECSAPDRPDPALLERAFAEAAAGGLPPDRLPRDFRRPVGCPGCSGGYRGRIAVVETLAMAPALDAAVRRNAPAEEIRDLAVAGGMTTMTADGVRKAGEGRTTLEEVFRVV